MSLESEGPKIPSKFVKSDQTCTNSIFVYIKVDHQCESKVRKKIISRKKHLGPELTIHANSIKMYIKRFWHQNLQSPLNLTCQINHTIPRMVMSELSFSRKYKR